MQKTVDEARRRRRLNRALIGCVWLLCLAAWLWFGNRIFLALFLAMTVMTPLSYFVQLAAAKHIDVSLQAPALPVQKGQSIEARVVLRNRSRFPVHNCTLTVTCRNAYTDECEQFALSAHPAPKGETEVCFQTSSVHCGYLLSEITGVTVSDMFGILTHTRTLPEAVSAGTPVFPDVYPVTVAVSPLAAEGFAQSERLTAQKGTDLSQSVRLRAFEPGDTLRQVHWKLSEKTGSWITREGAADGKDALLLYWDPSGSTQSPALADALADAVTSVCYALLDSGIPFRFAWTLSDDAAFALPVAPQEMNTRILEAVRRQTDPRQTPDALTDGSRVLFFSVHRPADTADNITYVHCDDGCPASGQPLRELIV